VDGVDVLRRGQRDDQVVVHAFCCSFTSGFRKADIDRRHVAIALRGSGQDECLRPAPAARGDIAVLQEVRHAHHQRRLAGQPLQLRLRGQPWGHRLAIAFKP